MDLNEIPVGSRQENCKSAKKPAKSKSLVVHKKKPTRLRRLEVEVVDDRDPINAVHRVVHTVGEAAKAVTNLVDVMKPIIDGFRRR